MKKLIIFCLICLAAASCKKWDEYRTLVPEGEARYPGIDSAIFKLAGHNRLQLYWRPSPDPAVTGFIIYWNDGGDSLILPSKSTNPEDTIRTIITGLPEGAYNFTVYSYDARGNRSIPKLVSNARTYGSQYLGNLYNRSLQFSKPGEYVEGGALRLYFNTPDTINIRTEVRYQVAAGTWQSANILPEESSIDLQGIVPGSKFAYRSSYIPSLGSIDTFYVNRYDSSAIAP